MNQQLLLANEPEQKEISRGGCRFRLGSLPAEISQKESGSPEAGG